MALLPGAQRTTRRARTGPAHPVPPVGQPRPGHDARLASPRRRARLMRHVTVKDVPAAAGVSVGTVSKALNGRGKLRTETRARVLRVAEQLGFVPTALAQGLLAGRQAPPAAGPFPVPPDPGL